jgi:hypothetical protein
MPPLAKHVPYSQSQSSEVEQNDDLRSVVAAFLFAKDLMRFATLRWVLDRKTKRSLDVCSD